MVKTRAPLGEFGRIERYFRPLTRGFPGALDLTDDAALLAVPPGHELVVTADAIVAGVHFLPDDPPVDIARKALRVNLSDLAAKGARPLAYTLTLALGREIDDGWVEAFASGLASDQAVYDIALVGGDSVSTAGPIWASITAFGLVETGRLIRRGGAHAGDVVMVSGTIGDAALGLDIALGRLDADEDDRAALLDRYRLPRPRSRLAPAISAFATAALDISDGLVADFAHLCRASRLRGMVALPRIPLSPAARRVVESGGARLTDLVTGGDDYEVLLTTPPHLAPALAAAAAAAGASLTEIGRVAAPETAQSAGETIFVDSTGAPVTLERAGWTHS